MLCLCFRDKDGYHWLTGRVDDVINVRYFLLIRFCYYLQNSQPVECLCGPYQVNKQSVSFILFVNDTILIFAVDIVLAQLRWNLL